MKNRAQTIIKKFNERSTSLLDLLNDTKNAILTAQKPKTDKDFTQAVQDELYQRYSDNANGMKEFYRALYNMVTTGAKKGTYLSVNENFDLGAYLAITEELVQEDLAKDAARDLSDIIPNINSIVTGRSDAGYVALMLMQGLEPHFEKYADLIEVLEDNLENYEPEDERAFGTKENIQRKIWLLRQVESALSSVDKRKLSNALKVGFADDWPNDLDESMSDNVDEAKKPTAANLASTTRALKKVLPTKFKSMFSNAFVGAVSLSYEKEEDAQEAVDLATAAGYEAALLGFYKNMSVWGVGIVPK